ncbi:nitrogen fixation protein NifM [Zoogloea sp. LCSB751]|uniref:nitrogen fixation protein NifM n=1 Tax=Zoogloea sp. LCSB751 TaxID=1965277 RepID=UPI0009A5449D|nr:nitrogen fixation protein NifM [Zoogloea sp. LCSB751]
MSTLAGVPDTTLPYLVFKTAHGIYEKMPGELSERELRHVRQVAKKQLDIETLVLTAPEAQGVVVPQRTLDDAFQEIRGRYESEQDFVDALAAQNLDEALLTSALQRELKVEAVLDRVSAKSAKVAELDVQIFYHMHREQFMRTERRGASHILVTINPDLPENTPALALKKINEIRKRLLKDPKRFAEQALKHSECPTAMNGGTIGEVDRGKLYPALDAALFAAKAVGELSEVVESELGYHIVRCDSIRAEGVAPYAEVAPRIRLVMEQNRRKLCQHGWLKELQEAATAKAREAEALQEH